MDFQHIDKRIGLLEVHTTKISWRGLLTVVWASKYYKKGSKYYKKGEGIKRYTSTPPKYRGRAHTSPVHSWWCGRRTVGF